MTQPKNPTIEELAKEVIASCPETCFSNNSYREWRRDRNVLEVKIVDAIRQSLITETAPLIEALTDIKYHACNPFASKDGEANRQWLAYCEDVAHEALESFKKRWMV